MASYSRIRIRSVLFIWLVVLLCDWTVEGRGRRSSGNEGLKGLAHWTTSPWQNCVVLNPKKPCGIGLKTRMIHCRKEGRQVQDSLCDQAKRPDIEMDCSVRCNLFDENMKWYIQPWTECERFDLENIMDLDEALAKDAMANYGLASRNISCATRVKDPVNQRLVLMSADENECMELALKPANVTLCNPPEPQDCIVSDFGEWSWCSGAGTEQYRYRHVLVAPLNDGKPCPPMMETRPCANTSRVHVPVEAKVVASYRLKMGKWSPCTAAPSIWFSNGTAHLSDARGFSQDASVFVREDGSPVEESFDRALLYQPTLGDQRRSFECIDKAGRVVDIELCFSTVPEQVRMCVMDVDCGYTEPTGWTLTDKGCRTANRTWPHVFHRTRTIYRLPEGNGKPCKPQKEVKYILDGLEDCSELFEVQAGPWSKCSIPSDLGGHSVVKCGGGLTTRKKICLLKGTMAPVSMAYCSRFSSDTALEIKQCSVECKVDCEVGGWSEWSRCKHLLCKTLETPNDDKGYRTRRRDIITNPSGGGAECKHLEEVEACVQSKCYEWIAQQWTTCLIDPARKQSCGHGVKTREVLCKDLNGNTVPNKLCDSAEVPECQAECYIPCSHDCVYSEWSDWSICPLSCSPPLSTSTSPRSRQRSRFLIGLPLPLSTNCTKELIEREGCPVSKCGEKREKRYAWLAEKWGDCESEHWRHPHQHHATMRMATRRGPPARIYNMPGFFAEVGQSIVIDEQNIGKVTRKVACVDVTDRGDATPNTLLTYYNVTDANCEPLVKPIAFALCNWVSEDPPCEVTDWSDWTACSTLCNPEESVTGQVSRRTRLIIGGRVGDASGRDACMRETEMRPCQPAESRCRTYKWILTPWSPCQLTGNLRCGTGYRTRGVYCAVNDEQNVVEPGWCLDTYQWAPQLVQPCFVDCDLPCVQSQWSTWSECPSKCYHNVTSYRATKLLLSHFIANTQVMTNEDVKMCETSARSAPLCQTARIGQECLPSVEMRACTCGLYQVRADERWSSCIIHNASVIVSNGWPDDSGVCGAGTRYRRRLCFDQHNVLSQPSKCELDSLIEEESCEVPCPQDCVLTEWGAWTACSEKCIPGIQRRYRNVLVEPKFGGRACGSLTDERSCLKSCSQFDWLLGPFSDCFQPIMNNVSYVICGTGARFRTIRCIDKGKEAGIQAVPNDMCKAKEKPGETEECTVACPGDCIYSKWSPWSYCEHNCEGISERTREVVRESADPNHICNATFERMNCSVNGHCHHFFWKPSRWSSCIVDGGELGCGNGTQTRIAQCLRGNRTVVDDSFCPPRKRPFKLQNPCLVECPIDCTLAEWSAWNTSDCKSGDVMADQYRHRKVLVASNVMGRSCPENNTEHKPCPVDVHYKWLITAWSSCNLNGTACGHGMKTRQVGCYHGKLLVGHKFCMGSHKTIVQGESADLIETDINSGDAWRLGLETETPCFVPCDLDCVMSPWSPWSLCHRHCNLSLIPSIDPSLRDVEDGYQTRSRVIVALNRTGGEPCPDDQIQTRPCRTPSCYDYHWAEYDGQIVCKRSDGVIVFGGCDDDAKCHSHCKLTEEKSCICATNECNQFNASCSNELHVRASSGRCGDGPMQKGYIVHCDKGQSEWTWLVAIMLLSHQICLSQL